jgi:hypothetical protein
MYLGTMPGSADGTYRELDVPHLPRNSGRLDKSVENVAEIQKVKETQLVRVMVAGAGCRTVRHVQVNNPRSPSQADSALSAQPQKFRANFESSIRIHPEAILYCNTEDMTCMTRTHGPLYHGRLIRSTLYSITCTIRNVSTCLNSMTH